MKKNVTLCKNCLYYERDMTNKKDSKCGIHGNFAAEDDFCSEACPIPIDFTTVKLLSDVLDYLSMSDEIELNATYSDAVDRVLDVLELLETENDFKSLCYSIATADDEPEGCERNEEEAECPCRDDASSCCKNCKDS